MQTRRVQLATLQLAQAETGKKEEKTKISSRWNMRKSIESKRPVYVNFKTVDSFIYEKGLLTSSQTHRRFKKKSFY